MIGERDMGISLRRLAILESAPLQTTDELLEWNNLRKWVIDNELLEEYKSQDYFACADEVTTNGFPPKNPKPIFSRFWNFIRCQ